MQKATKSSKVAWRAAIGLVLLGGCGDGPGATGTVDMASGGPLPELVGQAVVVAGDFTSPLGSLSTVKLSDRSVRKSIDTSLDSDSVVRASGGKVWVLSRTKGVLRIYDPAADYKNPVEILTGDSMVKHDLTDPTDVLPVAGTSRAYLALYTNDAAHAVGVVDTTRPNDGVVKWIAVPAALKSPLPRPTQLWACGSLVYVLLEDLDLMFALTGPGRIAVIDTATDKLVEDGKANVFTLAGSNPGSGFPYGMARLGEACDDVVVAAAGDLSGKTMELGGIERVDLAARASKGMLVLGSDLKGNIGSISVATPHLLYAVVGAFPNKVIAFDPTDKKVLGDVLGPANFIPFVQVSPDGKAVLAGVNGSTMGQAAAGLYVAAADGKPIAGPPLTFDQPPYGISFF